MILYGSVFSRLFCLMIYSEPMVQNRKHYSKIPTDTKRLHISF